MNVLIELKQFPANNEFKPFKTTYTGGYFNLPLNPNAAILFICIKEPWYLDEYGSYDYEDEVNDSLKLTRDYYIKIKLMQNSLYTLALLKDIVHTTEVRLFSSKTLYVDTYYKLVNGILNVVKLRYRLVDA